MTPLPKLQIEVTIDAEQFINERIASGRYRSAGEVVQEGLRLLVDREERRLATAQELRQLLALGVDQARQGEVREGEKVVADLLRRHEEHRGGRGWRSDA